MSSQRIVTEVQVAAAGTVAEKRIFATRGLAEKYREAVQSHPGVRGRAEITLTDRDLHEYLTDRDLERLLATETEATI